MHQPISETDLQARLAAAGVVDRASLEQALAADPELERAYNNFAEASLQLIIQELMKQFKAVTDHQELAAFWERVPSDLEDTFISIVEQMVAQAEQIALDQQAIDGLRQRLEDMRQLQANQIAMTQLLQQFLALKDEQALIAFWQQVPADREEAFVSTVELIIDQAEDDGEQQLATSLRQNLAALRQFQANQAAMADLFEQFLAVADGQALVAFWQQVPSDLKDNFVTTVEQIIAQAEREGEQEFAADLRHNLAAIRHIQAN